METVEWRIKACLNYAIHPCDATWPWFFYCNVPRVSSHFHSVNEPLVEGVRVRPLRTSASFQPEPFSILIQHLSWCEERERRLDIYGTIRAHLDYCMLLNHVILDSWKFTFSYFLNGRTPKDKIIPNTYPRQIPLRNPLLIFVLSRPNPSLKFEQTVMYPISQVFVT